MLFVNFPARANEYTETCSQRAGSTRETSKKAKGGTAVASQHRGQTCFCTRKEYRFRCETIQCPPLAKEGPWPLPSCGPAFPSLYLKECSLAISY